MKEPIPRWQAVAGFITLMMAVMGMWLTLSGQIKQDGKDYENHEQRIRVLEDTKKEVFQRFDKVDGKIDRMTEQNTQILILLQNKADRK